MSKTKVAIIGTGNMGRAVAESLLGEEMDIVCTCRSAETMERLRKDLPGVTVTDDNVEAVREADIVMLAVKPYVVVGVIDEIKEHLKPGALLVSVIANLNIIELGEITGASEKEIHIFRVIPNTAIKYLESVTFISHSEDCTNAEVDEIERIFNLSGRTFIVPEKDLNACSTLASCGIAFFLRFIRAAAEGSVELGLKPGFATEIAALTAKSAAAVLSEGSHPEAEIDKVTTPGGLTIKGLNAMEAAGFTNAVIAGLKASCPAPRK